MTADKRKLTLGQAIDQIVEALEGLDDAVRLTAITAACQSVGVGYDGTKARASIELPLWRQYSPA
jgi:hypothetical protein